MTKDRTTYTDGEGLHSYDIEVFIAGSFDEKKTFEVHGYNRDNAARKVTRDGHRVRSVNMTA